MVGDSQANEIGAGKLGNLSLAISTTLFLISFEVQSLKPRGMTP